MVETLEMFLRIHAAADARRRPTIATTATAGGDAVAVGGDDGDG
jgi:hypothetical protein